MGGGNKFLLLTGTEMQRRGDCVMVLFPETGPAVAAARDRGLEIEVAAIPVLDSSAPLRSLLGIARTLTLVRRLRPHVVHVNGISAARLFALPCRCAGVPLICHNHRMQPITDSELVWAFRYLPVPRVLIDVCETAGVKNRDRLWQHWPRTMHAVVRNGIDLGDLPAVVLPPRPERPDRSDHPFRIGSVANLLPVKRIEDLIDMAALLVRARPKLELWLIGDDSLDPDYCARLRTRCATAGLNDHVRFLGRRGDVAALLGELDLVVHAAEHEACPFALLEALAHGVPVVACANGGVAEIIEHGSSGWLVPPRRPDLLAEQVEALLDNPAGMQRSAELGRRRVEDLFDIRASVASLREIYARLVATASAKDPE